MPSDPAAMLDYMFKLHTVVYIEYSSLAVLLFDYMLTFGREVNYVWFKSPWNFGRMLYFLTRYLPFGGVFLTFLVDVLRNASLSTCKILTQAAVYSTVADVIIAEIVLTMRVWAIWSRSRFVCFGLTAIALALASLCVATVARVPVQEDTFGTDLHSAYGVCPPYFANSSAITTCWVVLVAYESVLLILTLAKAIDLYRHRTGGTSSLINIFFVDGLSYNGFILASSTANIIVRYKTTPSEYINLLTSLQPVVHSVLTSRMMLHLKQDAVKSSESNHLPSTQLQFAARPGQPPTESSLDHARSWFGEALQHPLGLESEQED
ncbi:hypothetical protein E1B28_009072 [Marasmius oreades]|uniref:DUF6533 domain-containing protein n=1 Tax=Marasmius oreades TaxID=181124 RepID=A0A9P7RZV4_9AGAR|nr:uncharacterized protein E1B28_009072 [Marasmius oreades]KAG7092745.1 hypothetical protein E1B28_009072 [Marasmius oreades]